MALETLKGLRAVSGHPVYEFDGENGTLGGEETDYIQVNHENNSVTFYLQDGPDKKVGVNGCQVSEMIEVSGLIIKGLDDNFPCYENKQTLVKLSEAIMWQEERTKNRETVGVEGTNANH